MSTQSIPPVDPSNERKETQEPRTIQSTELFAGQKVVVIEHDGTAYRLLITRNNRLILQK